MRAGDFLAAAAGLPVLPLGAIVGEGGVVVVAPHPDDESLGCGALIAGACARGIAVRLVVVSDGAGSHPNSPSHPPERLRDLREQETLLAVGHLGLAPEHVRFLRLPDRFVPAAGAGATAAAEVVARTAAACRASAVFVTWRHDPHCDHAASAAIVDLARARMPGARVYEYVVWGRTLPADAEVGAPPRGARLEVGVHGAARAAAIAAHRSQTTGLIDDDPTAFRLTEAMIADLTGPYETFLSGVAPAGASPP